MISIKKLKRYFKVGIDKIAHEMRTEVFLRTGRFMPRPLKVYYLMTNKCNFRCKMCPQWKAGASEKVEEYISAERMKRLIDEMAESGMKELGISGGEALIFREKLFDILEYANAKGLLTHFVSNGLLLTEDVLDRYESIGGGYVSLSIDAIGEKHSELRGHEQAAAGVERVLEIFSRRRFKNINLKINVVISNENIDDVLAVMKKAVGVGAVVFLQPYDHCDYACSKDEIPAKHPLWVQPQNIARLESAVSDLISLKAKHPEAILNDKEHIAAMAGYFKGESVGRTCFALLDQITIDPFGKVIACIFNEYGDLRKTSLKSFLDSKERKNAVAHSLRCQMGCLLGCMFRPSLSELLRNGPKQLLRLAKK